MSLENRLKRGMEAHAADMEDNVSNALADVRGRAAGRRRMQFVGAGLAAAAIFLIGVIAGPSIISSFQDDDPRVPIGGETPEPSPAPDTSPSEAPSDDPEPSPEPGEDGFVRHTVWFTMGEHLQSSTRFTSAGLPAGEAEELLTKLLARPNADEQSAGFASAIPPGTTLNGVSVNENGEATVDLSAAFDDGGGSLSMEMRVAQVVWTMRPFAKRIYFEVDGDHVESIGGEGVMVNPARPQDFKDLLAPITVGWPYPGATLTDLDTISGTANTFEANVVYRVLDANGRSVLVNDKKKRVDEWFTTATCGTGCRGTWEAVLDLDFDGIQEGMLEVYERSAENGEPINVVRIPVSLDPSADGN